MRGEGVGGCWMLDAFEDQCGGLEDIYTKQRHDPARWNRPKRLATFSKGDEQKASLQEAA